jgi:hypothetical protein
LAQHFHTSPTQPHFRARGRAQLVRRSHRLSDARRSRSDSQARRALQGPGRRRKHEDDFDASCEGGSLLGFDLGLKPQAESFNPCGIGSGRTFKPHNSRPPAAVFRHFGPSPRRGSSQARISRALSHFFLMNTTYSVHIGDAALQAGVMIK